MPRSEVVQWTINERGTLRLKDVGDGQVELWADDPWRMTDPASGTVIEFPAVPGQPWQSGELDAILGLNVGGRSVEDLLADQDAAA